MGLLQNKVGKAGRQPSVVTQMTNEQMAAMLTRLSFVLDNLELKDLPPDPDRQFVSIAQAAKWDSSGLITGVMSIESGSSSVAITGLTADFRAVVSLYIIGGTTTDTWQYQGVCATDTLTISALKHDGTVNTLDASAINYIIFQTPAVED